MQSFYKQEVTLEEVLDAREKRAVLQEKMRSFYGANVVSIGLNIPGRIKYSEEIVGLLYGSLETLRDCFQAEGFLILAEHIYHAATGPGAVLAVAGDSLAIKRLAVELEEKAAYARLLDIDVFDSAGQQISRSVLGLAARKCLLCDRAAVSCMRDRTHSPIEVSGTVRKLLISYQTIKWQESLPEPVQTIGVAALEAMLMEVACTPAPGLVDRFNTGAHTDMDIFTFIKSSSVLSVAMLHCAFAGWQHKGEPEELLPVLRSIGKEAETKMFSTTQGVNTQKGILFLMGIMAAAAANTIRNINNPVAAQQVTAKAAEICRGIIERELAPVVANPPSRKLTGGERFYKEYGITGIRGEIEDGLPSVLTKGLPCFKEGLGQGLSLNDALVHALLGLISVSQDTTVLNRHGLEVLQEVQVMAAQFMEGGGMLAEDGTKRVTEMDKLFISRNISPGGAADLLAVTYFLYLMEKRF